MRGLMGLAMRGIGGVVSGLLLAANLSAGAQTALPEPDANAGRAPKRIHLILKDGSYQIVTSYKVAGKVVRYVSAERAGEEEEIPTELVDLAATQKWEQQHMAPPEGRAPVLDPELLKEEEDRAALTPSVEPDLLLPQEDSFVALDFYQGTPELVPLVQSDGDLNRTTAHSIVKKIVNPRAASHQLLTLHGEKSYVQLHVDTPDFYVRVGDDAQVATGGGTPLVVDTHGASSVKVGNEHDALESRYVIVRADVRTDARLIASFGMEPGAAARPGADVVETKSEVLRGGHWMKLTPLRALEFGEYALVEVLSDKEVNLAVWDFGVHPMAGDNRDALKPEPKKRPGLERRKPE